jgi:hypothetical protein
MQRHESWPLGGRIPLRAFGISDAPSRSLPNCLSMLSYDKMVRHFFLCSVI